MKSKSSKRALASIVLSFESIVIFFATLTAFGLKSGNPELGLPDTQLIWAIGLSVAILAIVTPAVLKNPWGYWFGWAVQAALLVSGFWLWGMFVIGAILTGMWIWALVAGQTIDVARAKYQELQSEGE